MNKIDEYTIYLASLCYVAVVLTVVWRFG